MAFAGGIGAILGAIGSIAQGVLGFAAANYQAQVAEMNEEVAKDNAMRSIERAQVEQQTQDDLTAAMLGEQESVQSASGLSLTSPSAIRTRAAARRLGRMDALNVRQAGEIEKYNYLVQASNFGSEAKMAQLQGVGNLLSGFLGATQSLVSKAKPSKMASRFGPQLWATS